MCTAPPFGPEQMPNVYNNVIKSFQNTGMTAVYLVAQVALGFHLYHGSWSIFQSLGLSHRRYNDTVRSVAVAFAIVVVLGFAARSDRRVDGIRAGGLSRGRRANS